MKPFSKERYAQAATVMRSMPELDSCVSGHDKIYISDLLENAITMIELNEEREKKWGEATKAKVCHELNRRSIEQLQGMMEQLEKRVRRVEDNQRGRGWN
jgi:hypothetical protein